MSNRVKNYIGGCFQNVSQVSPPKFGGFMIHFDFPIFLLPNLQWDLGLSFEWRSGAE